MKSTLPSFKKNLQTSFIDAFAQNPDARNEIIKDLTKYNSEMKENENLEGGLSDKKSLLDIAMKHAFKDNVLTTGHKINSILGILKSELKKGIEVEMEHTDNRETAIEIAKDHLYEDPHYYSKLKKMETKEQIIRKSIKKGLTDKLLTKTKMDKPIGKLYSMGKTETKENGEKVEATGTGSSGAYSAPLFGSEFIKKSDKETPKLEEGLATGAMGLDKVEAKEATTSGSVGGYSSPSMWAKSTSKKDWGPSRKSQIPGGSFVKVKKKCTKFPYCNQGDINALKITKSESVKEIIKAVSHKLNLSENVIINILEYEFEKLQTKK